MLGALCVCVCARTHMHIHICVDMNIRRKKLCLRVFCVCVLFLGWSEVFRGRTERIRADFRERERERCSSSACHHPATREINQPCMLISCSAVARKQMVKNMQIYAELLHVLHYHLPFSFFSPSPLINIACPSFPLRVSVGCSMFLTSTIPLKCFLHKATHFTLFGEYGRGAECLECLPQLFPA